MSSQLDVISQRDTAPPFPKLRLPKLHKNYGSKLEAKIFYENVYDEDSKSGVDWVEHVPSQLPANTRQRFDSAAIQIYKRVDSEKTFNHVPTYKTSFIKIQSPFLMDHLKSILEGTDVVFREKDVEFQSPFQPLYFAWGDIERRYNCARQGPDQEDANHLAVLWRFMNDELLETFERVRFLRNEGRISCDLLWTLFPQGRLVLSTWNGYQQAYRVLSCGESHKDKSSRRPSSWIIRCEFVEFDGYEYGYSETTMDCAHFNDTKPITALPIYPWEYVHEGTSLQQSLINRGRAMLDFQAREYKFYDGIALDLQATASKFNIVSRIIIDPYLYARTSESRRRKIRPFREIAAVTEVTNKSVEDRKIPLPVTRKKTQSEEDKSPGLVVNRGRPDSDQQLVNRRFIEADEQHQLLMSPLLDGYSLNDKKWMNFLIEWVKPLELVSAAFEELVLPSDYKDLVLAYAQQQDEKVQEVDDVIPGKGQGLIVLLSGPPGTGKTLTAEAVADKVGRPLYHVDTHELGTDVETLSIKLRQIMNMAAEWNAIVLLDEADVFLQKRSPENYSRNERIAVFLREIEYYRGTLFLTTNLLDNIDEAMESRVHVHIVFDPLLAPARAQIWANFVKKIHAYDISITDSDIQDLARWTLNGRQIKNAVQMAANWCSRMKEPLNVQNTEKVIRLTSPKAVKELEGEFRNGST